MTPSQRRALRALQFDTPVTPSQRRRKRAAGANLKDELIPVMLYGECHDCGREEILKPCIDGSSVAHHVCVDCMPLRFHAVPPPQTIWQHPVWDSPLMKFLGISGVRPVTIYNEYSWYIEKCRYWRDASKRFEKELVYAYTTGSELKQFPFEPNAY